MKNGFIFITILSKTMIIEMKNWAVGAILCIWFYKPNRTAPFGALERKWRLARSIVKLYKETNKWLFD